MRNSPESDPWDTPPDREEYETAMNPFPATQIVHCPSGPVPACDSHAESIRGLLAFLGAHTNATPALSGEQCRNCENEAARKSKEEAK